MGYLEEHDACGLKVGDKVKVIRAAADYEGGWGALWASDMDRVVGGVGEILNDEEIDGFRLSFGVIGGGTWIFPYFILEKFLSEDDKVTELRKKNITKVCAELAELREQHHEACGVLTLIKSMASGKGMKISPVMCDITELIGEWEELQRVRREGKKEEKKAG